MKKNLLLTALLFCIVIVSNAMLQTSSHMASSDAQGAAAETQAAFALPFEMEAAALISREKLVNLDLDEDLTTSTTPDLLKFIVLDGDGLPLKDARAYASALSEPTNEYGEGVIKLNQSPTLVAFAAKGFRLQREIVSASVNDDYTHVVVLERDQCLTISWNYGTEIDLRDSFLRLSTIGDQVFQSQAGRTDWAYRAVQEVLNAPRSDSFGSKSKNLFVDYLKLSPAEESTHVYGLATGKKFEVALVDSKYNLVSDPIEVLILEGEDQFINLNVINARSNFSGIVLDEKGRPINNAMVEIMGKEMNSKKVWAYTSIDGAFSFPNLVLGVLDVSVTVRNAEYSKWRRKEFIFEAKELGESIVLAKPRQIRLAVVDQTGNPVNVGRGKFYYDNIYIRARVDAENSEVIFEDVPESEFELTWIIGGLVGTALIPANVSEYRLLAGAMGSLDLHLFRRNAESTQFFRLEFSELVESNEPRDFKISFKLQTGIQGQDLEFNSVQPGIYNIALQFWGPEAENENGFILNTWIEAAVFKEIEISNTSYAKIECDL